MVTKKKILKWGGYPGSFRWAQCNHINPYNRKNKGQVRAGDMTEAEGSVLRFEN